MSASKHLTAVGTATGRNLVQHLGAVYLAGGTCLQASINPQAAIQAQVALVRHSRRSSQPGRHRLVTARPQQRQRAATPPYSLLNRDMAPNVTCMGRRQMASSGASCSPRCTEAPTRARRSVARVSSRRCVVHVAAVAANSNSNRPRDTAAYAALAAAPSLTGLEGLQRLQFASGGWPDLGGEPSEPQAFDVLALAQSMVDVTTEDAIEDHLLPSLGVDKGGRRVLESAEERHSVLSTLDDAGCVTKITPGGSLANTLVGIARLSSAAAASRRRHRPLRVALGTSCGTDPIGQFFSSQLHTAGVSVLPSSLQASPNGGHTGTVFVLPSPDAQRSFLSFFTSETLALSTEVLRTAARCRLLVIEGYLWELPGAADAIRKAVETARAGGARVALTAGDPGVVARNRDSILRVLSQGGEDIMFFSNMEEACELVGRGRSCCARSAAGQLSAMCAVAVVTDGGRGSYVASAGRVTTVPPVEPPGDEVVDTCGAGDAYAAGFIYALAAGVTDARAAGGFASLVAARVISRHGAQLQEEEAQELAAMLPEATPLRPASAAAAAAALPTLLRPAAVRPGAWQA